MAFSLYVQKPEDFFQDAEYASPWIYRTVAPRGEALTLFAMVGRNGETLESVRELIAIAPQTETKLLLLADRNPEDASGLGACSSTGAAWRKSLSDWRRFLIRGLEPQRFGATLRAPVTF